MVDGFMVETGNSETGGDSMIEAMMKDEKGTEVRFSKANECLVDASVARADMPLLWSGVLAPLR